MMRVGMGVDAHRLVANRPLILGGIHIPYHKGLLGHSDADVLTHTLIDACLGALFPSTLAFKDVRSVLLLEKTMEWVREKGYEVVNTDSVIVAQEPKLMPYVQDMMAVLSKVLGSSSISIKATTFEGLGFEGKKQGISCQTVVLLNKI